jgi:hypothetical protein
MPFTSRQEVLRLRCVLGWFKALFLEVEIRLTIKIDNKDKP